MWNVMPLIQHLKWVTLSGAVFGFLFCMPCQAGEAAGSDEAKVIRSYNKTALQLYRELGEESKNLVLSPYSIGTVMAMALSGARGDTETEMAQVLNQILPRELIESANSNILERLNRVQNRKDLVFSTTNALCLTRHEDQVQDFYRDLIRTKYHAELFRSQDVTPINAWVSKQTHERIDKILEKLNPNSVCVLLNAVYFKGLWASQFDKNQTRPGNFYVTEHKTVSVPMMHQTAEYPLVKRADFMAIAMPYTVESLEMIVILPKETAGLAKIEGKLTIEAVQSTLDDLERGQPTKVMLSLPRFKIEYGASLIPAFQTLGMELAFSATKADFGGITGQANALGLIWISQIAHQAFLEVNEEGSEAAAATAGEFAKRSMPRITRFQVDRPFLFLLVDKSSDAILFMGRVNNPLET